MLSEIGNVLYDTLYSYVSTYKKFDRYDTYNPHHHMRRVDVYFDINNKCKLNMFGVEFETEGISIIYRTDDKVISRLIIYTDGVRNHMNFYKNATKLFDDDDVYEPIPSMILDCGISNDKIRQSGITDNDVLELAKALRCTFVDSENKML